MLVKECMTRHPIIISPTTRAAEAQQIMAENNVRHLPVASAGKHLEGLVTRTRLTLKPDLLGSLNMWEISRQLSNLTVKDVMVKKDDVLTVLADRTIERAAKIMADNKVGCLLILDTDSIVEGIISEIDILRSYQVLMGLPVDGLRVTVRMPNRKGEFAKLMKALADNDWGVMGIGTYPSHRREGFYDAVLKIPGVTADDVRAAFSQISDQEVVDVRDVV
ncbi:CBS domain-containing protein [Candidatus Leptofilum sp.]|uniref:CBS domain-containing protein n=1 Tax=Candidatus Leptofilum sp. TaxID=3241576 RepID=UPI003B5CFE44